MKDIDVLEDRRTDLSDVREEGYAVIPLEPEHWRTAGHGGFHFLEGEAQSDGGPGLLWYTREAFGDFVLKVDWRASSRNDNSGVFLRIPELGTGNPDKDWKPAVDLGYEIQIDDRGVAPEAGASGDSFHRTGAIYGLAPATTLATRAVGEWNTFQIEARGREIAVWLNGEAVSRFDGDPLGRQSRGYIGLQCYGPGSRVAFRNLRIKRLS